MPDDAIKQFDLRGKLCPYCVMTIIREAGLMDAGQTWRFIVNDPLALKAVPEELEEFRGYSMETEKFEDGWAIVISRD